MTVPLEASRSRVKPMEGGASYPLRHRLLRVAWGIVWAVLASWTPPQARRWRVFLLRAFGARVHGSANIYGSAKVWYPPNLSIGAQATLGPDAICYCMDRIEIGERAIVSQRAHLCGGTHDIDDPDFQLRAFPIIIAADAWIAAEAFVGPGTRIGEGAVLGARGVTVKSLDPWTVYAGNPAKPIRARKRRGTARD